jgi:predicted amidohydrolase YtcJ
MMGTMLLHNAVIHTGTGATGLTALALTDGRVTWLGDEAGAAARDEGERIDGAGALIAPAFVDAHVHTVQTGFLETQVDLGGITSLRETLDLVADAAKRADDDDIVVGTGWDDSLWPERRAPTATELDEVAPGARVILTRLDGHSAVLSPTLIHAIEGLGALRGYDEHGHMTLDAMAHTSAALAELIGPHRRLDAARAAMQVYARNGIAAFHENAAAHIGPAYEIALVRQAAEEAGLLATAYWGEHLAIDMARVLGVAGLAGDLNADGSIGSRTAALHTAYDDRPGHAGHAYLTAEEIAAHVVACTRAGIQAGFHCIGESGLLAVTEGYRKAEEELGTEAIRAAGHRLEHVEMPGAETIAMMADLGLSASMQPLFDELWGGPDQMYAERLGERWRGMNPIGAIDRAGINIALGSDTPVTRPHPWAAIWAAVRHHEPEQRVDRESAFRMHTVGGWRAVNDPGIDPATGTLAPGAPAHLAVWDTELDGTLPPVGSSPTLRRLVVSGRTVFENPTTSSGQGT